jgi:Zn-dependent peptidase ImmA (M78 family)
MTIEELKRANVNYLSLDQAVGRSMISRNKIEEISNYIRDRFKEENGSLSDAVKNIVEWLGGRIHLSTSISSQSSGTIIVHKKGDFDILIPHNTGVLRDRFTLGHEIGHYILHSNVGKIPLIAHRQDQSFHETESNYFSAALLMPKEEFVKVYSDVDRNLELLSNHFFVSKKAAEVRVRALSL